MWTLALLWLAMTIGPVTPGAPNRQPQLASGYGVVAMTFASGDSIYFAASHDDGMSFSAAVKVAEVKGLAVGRHRGPRVVILKDAIVISAIAGDLISWRSTNGGKTWHRAGTVNDVRGAAREGLHAMAAGPSGELFAVWLDLRANGTKLYGARSTDGGETWSPNVRIYSSPDGTICQCCDPSIAISGDATITVMWRNLIAGARDLYVASSHDGVHFDAARKLGEGTWKLDACPMDGGGMVIYRGTIWSAWRRDRDVFIHRMGSAEERLGAGADVAIAAGSKGIYVAWSQGPAIEIHVPGAAQPTRIAQEGAFVNLTPLADGSILAAWEQNGSIALQHVE